MTRDVESPRQPDEQESPYRRLPARVSPDDLVTEVPASSQPDPAMGRDPETDWLLRTV